MIFPLSKKFLTHFCNSITISKLIYSERHNTQPHHTSIVSLPCKCQCTPVHFTHITASNLTYRHPQRWTEHPTCGRAGSMDLARMVSASFCSSICFNPTVLFMMDLRQRTHSSWIRSHLLSLWRGLTVRVVTDTAHSSWILSHSLSLWRGLTPELEKYTRPYLELSPYFQDHFCKRYLHLDSKLDIMTTKVSLIHTIRLQQLWNNPYSS